MFADNRAYLALLRLNDIKIYTMDLETGAVSKYTQYDGKNQRLHLVRGGALLVGEAWGDGYDLGWVREADECPELTARFAGFGFSARVSQSQQGVTAAFENRLHRIPEP